MPISVSIPAMDSESRSFIWQPIETMWNVCGRSVIASTSFIYSRCLSISLSGT